MASSLSTAATFDATVEQALESGLLSERALDLITDAIARGHITEQSFVEYWAGKIAAADAPDTELSKFERVFCGAELKLNRITLHLDTPDVMALLCVK